MPDIVLPSPGEDPNWANKLNTAVGKVNETVDAIPADITDNTSSLGLALDMLTKNPETYFYANVLAIAAGATPGNFPYIFTATSITSPRPITQPGQVVWWMIVSDDPFATPLNMIDGDVVFVQAAESLPFSLAQVPGYGGDYDARSLTGNVADGGALTAYGWPDVSPGGKNLVTTPISGSITTVPTFDADAFGTSPVHPGVYFPSRSGVQTLTPGITPPTVLTMCNVRFRDVGTAATETVNTFGSTPFGRYSISRVGVVGDGTTPQRLQIANADATGYYQSAGGDFRGNLSLIGLWTPNGQQLYCNGTRIINHVESTPVAMPAMASFRLGFVSNAGDTGLAKAMVDGRINRFAWATPTDTSYLTPEIATQITDTLQALVGS